MGDDVNQDECSHDDASIPSFPIQGGASVSSSHDLPLWEQVLANQRAMQQPLNGMETFNHQLARRQRYM